MAIGAAVRSSNDPRRGPRRFQNGSSWFGSPLSTACGARPTNASGRSSPVLRGSALARRLALRCNGLLGRRERGRLDSRRCIRLSRRGLLVGRLSVRRLLRRVLRRILRLLRRVLLLLRLRLLRRVLLLLRLRLLRRV